MPIFQTAHAFKSKTSFTRSEADRPYRAEECTDLNYTAEDFPLRGVGLFLAS